MRDPYRCENCLAYWQPDANGLVLRMGSLVCRNRAACEQRVRLTDSLRQLCDRARGRMRRR